jgi:cell division protein FtsZ
LVLAEREFKEALDQERIEEIARLSMPTVSVVGVGGAGCNIVSWLKERGVSGGRLLALNTDANHLRISRADRRILIGEKITKGLGCGGYPQKGEQALLENLEDIQKELKGSNIVFITAGLGGGTGTGGSYALAEALSSTGAMLIGVVTLPFKIERVRRDNATKGIKNLLKYCDTVVALDNSKLVEVAGGLPFKQALGVANELIGAFVKGITETITTASLINIDYADLRAIMEKRGLAAIGVGEGSGSDRVERAAKNALDSQLLDINDVTQSHGVLVHVAGGQDMTLSEVTKAGEMVTRNLPPQVRIVWGARVDEDLGENVRVMCVLTGVESAFLEQEQRKTRKIGPFRI